MPSVTMTVELSDEMYDLLMKLPAPEREAWSAQAINSFAVAPNRPAAPIEKVDWAASSGPEVAARMQAMFDSPEWNTEDENELTVEELKANLNENRRLSGEELLF